MAKGFLKVSHELQIPNDFECPGHESELRLSIGKSTQRSDYIVKRIVQVVSQIPTLDQFYNKCVCDNCYEMGKHKQDITTMLNDRNITFPCYMIQTDSNRYFFVHPDENEHMERFISGTDDSLFEFVHELRYNVDMFATKTDVKRAKIDFESH